MQESIREEVQAIKERLVSLPVRWDGKSVIRELKDADFNWRQNEWIGWRFELYCRDRLRGILPSSGDRFGNTKFDVKGVINWDFKANSMNARKQEVQLNDIRAMNASIEQDGSHGIILGRFLVVYNDVDRSFQQWHDALKGEPSQYVLQRRARTQRSTPRKTSAELKEILFIVLDRSNIQTLALYSQGRNADGSQRNPKYKLTKRHLTTLPIDTLVFPPSSD